MKKEDSKNIVNFYKGREIADEIIGILRGRLASSKDDKQLRNFIVSNKYSKEVVDNLTDPNKISEICQSYRNPNKREEAQALESILNRKCRNSKRRRFVYATSSVAAVVALLFFSLFIDRQSQPPKASVIIQQMVPSVPVLIFSNGKEMKLNDNIKNDLIGKNGESKIVDKNSSVDYSDSINRIIIPSKYTFSVTLEDGTEVLLNANSELRYPVSFKKDRREVFLKGEGYFCVSKSKIPFVVKTNEISVKVYGTRFNINTNNETAIETILVEGSVGVTSKGGKEVIMTPNQMFTLNPISGKEELKEINPENYLGWVSDLFKCNNENLAVILEKVAVWHNVQFEYKNEESKKIPITIVISRTTDLDNIIDALEVITNLKFIKENDHKYVIE